MTTYTHDGTAFDLTRSYLDVTGVTWHWVGEYNAAGEPLMTAAYGCTVPLPDLYRDHGPLIPLPSALPDGALATALRAKPVSRDFADSVAAGYVESLAEYGARTGRPA